MNATWIIAVIGAPSIVVGLLSLMVFLGEWKKTPLDEVVTQEKEPAAVPGQYRAQPH